MRDSGYVGCSRKETELKIFTRCLGIATLAAALAGTVLPACAAQLGEDARSAIPRDIQQLIVVDYRAMQNSQAAMDLKARVLPPELKSVAVRARVRYAPHPFVWMAPARAMSTGLGLESDGLERKFDELPAWEEAKVKVYPMVCITHIHGSKSPLWR